MRDDKIDTVRGRMLAQRTFRARADLDVARADLDAGLAQVFGKNAPDFAVTDKTDMPVEWIRRHRFSSDPSVPIHQSTYFSPARSSPSRILYMSRPSTPSASFLRLS